MGQLEEKTKRKRRYGKIQYFILSSVAIAGVLSISLVAPNVLGAIAKLGLIPKKRTRESIAIAQKRLIKDGLLRQSGETLFLTKKGIGVLSLYQGGKKHTQKRRWDKRWRVLIFDIPERMRSYRARIREALRGYGFLLLQESVWIYPYNCEDFITLLKSELGLKGEMIYLIVESIEDDLRFKKKFNIK